MHYTELNAMAEAQARRRAEPGTEHAPPPRRRPAWSLIRARRASPSQAPDPEITRAPARPVTECPPGHYAPHGC